MIEIRRTADLPYPTTCYGCGRKNDENGIRIEVKNPARLRGEVLYLCADCMRELREK